VLSHSTAVELPGCQEAYDHLWLITACRSVANLAPDMAPDMSLQMHVRLTLRPSLRLDALPGPPPNCRTS
jgi:hypothetical protein